jgi:hypothetical protein
MDNSQNQHPDTTNIPQPEPLRNLTDEAQSKPLSGTSPKSLKSRPSRDFLIIFGIIGGGLILFGLIAGTIFVFNVGKSVSSIPSFCNKERIQKAADSLRNTSIGGSLPTTVNKQTSTDCIDGSGDISASVSYLLTAPNATMANTQVLNSLNIKPNTKNQTFVTLDINVNYVPLVETTFTLDNKITYVADYYFRTPIDCKGKCVKDPAALQAYDLLKQPISRIDLTVSGNVR